MAVRICTVEVPQFRHQGLVVGPGWISVDKTLTDAARAALRDHHGRFVRVHPEDVKKLSELGLAFKGAKSPLVELTATAPDTKKLPTKNDAPKGDGKKE